MALGNREGVSDFFQAYGGGGFKFLGGQAGIAELRGKRHGETPSVRGGEQLFRIGADTVFKTRAVGVLGLL